MKPRSPARGPNKGMGDRRRGRTGSSGTKEIKDERVVYKVTEVLIFVISFHGQDGCAVA